MYYLIYAPLYLMSLLPWQVLYLLSDAAYFLMYYVIGYRRKVVMGNLIIAFPEKTEEQRIRIAKEFYKNLLDTFIETIKFISISDKEFSKRLTGNFELLSELYSTGQSVQLHSGHFFNWEYMNWGVAKFSPYPFIGIYMQLSNKAFDKIMYNLRGRYNTILVSTTDFKTTFHKLATKQYSLGLAADQNPGDGRKGYWVRFFGKLTPFTPGPEKGAQRNNTAIVFVHFYKIKRGYYHADFELITTTPRSFPRGELTKKFASYVEDCIRKTPSNYLWSHRRWKHEFKEEMSNNLFE